ncbi:MAG: hypothetical protein Q9215_007633 [Flavoplaca cf. flavocitrina]
MNTRPAIDESTGPIALNYSTPTHASSRSLAVCPPYLTSAPKADRLAIDFNAGIGATEMLGKANYIALVGGGKNPKFPINKLIIWDDAKQFAAVTLEFPTQVLQSRLSRSQILIALHNTISLYAFSSPPRKVSSFETADNPSGLCSLGSKIIAFPGRTPGQVQMVEIGSGNVSIIPAHGTPLKAMTLSPNGEILATASETGTLIRLFSTTNCARIAELRRGVDPAAIFSLAISPSNTLLAPLSMSSTCLTRLHPPPPPLIKSPPRPRSQTAAPQAPTPPSPSPKTPPLPHLINKNTASYPNSPSSRASSQTPIPSPPRPYP